jgi:rSAM/selenodomain-associated transferase 1
MPDIALVIIARAPELNRVKTRLAAGIGGPGALFVYRQLLQIVSAVQETWPGPVLLTASGDDAAWQGTGLAHLVRRPQAEGGLGSRIANALHWGLETAGRAIAIGTDCPGLRRRHLDRLAAALDHVPVAFGPAEDGGYWGVGVRDPRVIPIIAEDALPWSTPTILDVSHQRLDQAGYRYDDCDVLADCDDADDLAAAVSAGLLTWPTAIRNPSSAWTTS